jgi:tRNA1Val (adenine37-N6)-methyltransferase
MTIELHPDETLDDLLHGELKLIQRRDGYRYSVDALLLSHFALPLVQGEVVLDMGTGSGVVALILAKRGRPCRVIGVELQKGLAQMARRNNQINRTSPAVEIMDGDACLLSLKFPPESFGVIVSNPPFFTCDSGQVSPNMERAFARHEIAMSLKRWLFEAQKLLARAGKIMIVFPSDQEDRLLDTAAGLGLSLARRQYALDRPGGSRRFILVDLRSQPCPIQDLPDIPIETEQGKFSLDGYK